ncbi:MAG: amidohydrolase family protein [Roseovarius sp.]|nr:amidohydrolase family protein [Roseovarius sp.]
MGGKSLVLRADWALTAPDQPPLREAVVRVEGGVIAAIGPALPVPDGVEVLDLGAAVLMPGLVNAHQHGRGVSQLLMGYPDTALEPWIAARKQHGAPDIRAVTRLAAEAMLTNGVTATLHANYTYGTGDYAQELRAQIAGYRDAGLRATICVGVQDRGFAVYPDADDAAFVTTLPKAAQLPAFVPYMPDWTTTRVLMDELQAELANDPLIRLAWGPAGPQWVSDGMWRAIVEDAAQRGIGVHFHLLESPAQAQAARRLFPDGTLAHLRRLGVLDGPASCAHGVYLSPDDRQIAAAEGLVVVLNPGANLRLYNGAPPVASMRAAGMRLAVGTDNCALHDDEDYLRELRLATTLGRSGLTRSSADEAQVGLGMATTNGAAALFLDDRMGTLASGRRADVAAFRLSGLGPEALIAPQRIAELLFARGSGRACCLAMVAGHVRFADRREDHARLHAAQARATASVAARNPCAAPAAIAQLQAALRRHYAERSGA